MDVLEIGVKTRKLFRVGEKDYALAFPLRIVAQLEEKLGRPMRMPSDWFRIETKEVPDVLEHGLRRYHPDEAAQVTADICDNLDPEEIGKVIDGLCVSACPEAMARVQDDLEKARERVKKGLPAFPNVPGVDAR